MRSISSRLLRLLPFALVAIVCAEDTKPNSFIRKRGAYTFDVAGSSIEVITAKDNKPSIALDFRTKGNANAGHMSFDQTGILSGEGWFIFIESTNRVWIFDGKSGLAVAERSEIRTKFVANIKADPEAAAVCPPEVKKSLPPTVRTSLFEKHP